MRRLVFLSCWLAASWVLAAPVSFTVHDHAVGDGPADLVSNGIPFKPGEPAGLL